MVDKKKTSVARLNIGLCYPPENAGFAFWLFVFKPVGPDPVGRPARNAVITPKWMVSAQHGRDPPFVRAPSPCRPGALSPDRLLTYFICTPFALLCRGKTGQEGIIAVRNMTMRREKAGGRPKPGRDWTLVSANTLGITAAA